MNARMKSLENFEQFKKCFHQQRSRYLKDGSLDTGLLQDARKFCFQILFKMLSKFKGIN